MSKKDFNWKKYLIECLESTNFCCIATVDPKGVWANPVYFSFDEKFNLYFISQMNSRHMQNLKKDSRISVAIFSTAQKGHIAGIQLEGNARILTKNDNKKEIQHAFDTYFGRAGKGPDVKDYINNPSWLYVKITSADIYYFNTRFFKDERQTVPKEVYE